VEKRKPHYLLNYIKAAFSDPGKLNRSFASQQGADALQMHDDAVVALIQKLTAADFHKSMKPLTPIIESGRTFTSLRLAKRNFT
jgi:hypothetical protein